MANEHYIKLAAALDAVADELDAQETDRVHAKTAAHTALVEQYIQLQIEAGHDVDDALRVKLASTDEHVLENFISLAESAAQVESMGSPADGPSKTASADLDALAAFCLS